MELDSGKQPNRFWDGYIKRLNTSNLPVPMEIKRVQADERIRKVATKRTEEFNTTHKLKTFGVGELALLKVHNVGKSEDNTATMFFLLYNGPFTLRDKVGKNTYIVRAVTLKYSRGFLRL